MMISDKTRVALGTIWVLVFLGAMATFVMFNISSAKRHSQRLRLAAVPKSDLARGTLLSSGSVETRLKWTGATSAIISGHADVAGKYTVKPFLSRMIIEPRDLASSPALSCESVIPVPVIVNSEYIQTLAPGARLVFVKTNGIIFNSDETSTNSILSGFTLQKIFPCTNDSKKAILLIELDARQVSRASELVAGDWIPVVVSQDQLHTQTSRP